MTGKFCINSTYSGESGDYGLGCYLDESLISDESVNPESLYITTPYVNLPKGSYQVSIVYDTDEDQHYSATSKFRTYPVIAGRESVNLSHKRNREVFSFFSPIKVDEYQVHIDYSGTGYMFVESIMICETSAWKNVLLFYVVLLSALFDLILLWYQRVPVGVRREARFTFAVILFLIVFTCVPILSYFMPKGDDLSFHLNRIEGIKYSLLSGQFPNRVSTFWNNGYGYASAVFYGEAFLYIPALLRILGVSVQGAYKFYVVAVNIATALISYYCFKKMFQGRQAAMIGCVVYMLAPYRLVCIYLRAAVGEYTAMAFYPIILYGLFRIYTEETEEFRYKSSWVPLFVGYTGLVQCHVLSCVMAGIFTGLFCLVFVKKTFQFKRLWQFVKAGTGVVLLNMWFLLPFADYFRLGYTSDIGNPLGRVNSNGAFFNQMITFFQQGIHSSYSIGESLDMAGERNYAVGGFLLIIFLYLCYRIYRGKENSPIIRMGDCSLAFAFLALFMCTIWFPWDFLQQMNGFFRMITRNIQLPWRFLGISTLLLTVTAICLVILLRSILHRHLYYGTVAVICVCFLLSADYFMCDYTQSVEMGRYANEKDLYSCALGNGEYLTDETHRDFEVYAVASSGEFLEILDEKHEGNTYIVECDNASDQDTYADIPFLPYRYYICQDNETGEELEVFTTIVPNRLRIIVPPRYHGTFTVVYQEPWYWRTAELVSLFTIIIGLIWFVRNGKRKRQFDAKEKL